MQQLRQESNLHDHSWSRDFPTTLAFTQANLNKRTRTFNPQEIFNDDFRGAFVNLPPYTNSAIFKLLWSGLFYYHIRNLASKYIRFNLTSNSSLLFLISANLASLILNIQFLTQVSPIQSLHIYAVTLQFTFKIDQRSITIQLVVTKVCVTTNEASVATCISCLIREILLLNFRIRALKIMNKIISKSLVSTNSTTEPNSN